MRWCRSESPYRHRPTNITRSDTRLSDGSGSTGANAEDSESDLYESKGYATLRPRACFEGCSSDSHPGEREEVVAIRRLSELLRQAWAHGGTY